MPILGRGVAENDANSQAASQEDLSLVSQFNFLLSMTLLRLVILITLFGSVIILVRCLCSFV